MTNDSTSIPPHTRSDSTSISTKRGCGQERSYFASRSHENGPTKAFRHHFEESHIPRKVQKEVAHAPLCANLLNYASFSSASQINWYEDVVLRRSTTQRCANTLPIHKFISLLLLYITYLYHNAKTLCNWIVRNLKFPPSTHKTLATALIFACLTSLHVPAAISLTKAHSVLNDHDVSDTVSRLSKGHIIFVSIPKYDNFLPLKHLAKNLYDRGYYVGMALPEVRNMMLKHELKHLFH
uniref:AlNc14C71G4868 protein n=1 Tax=Albugo laibachii Nc14 TaxID=890382 RepID=F0WE01_9STRA|nr:AlNc14C71G4868 [Albugo laibachii Nc14]|eukprot:CCA19430.1 AlNc14C71G4868 [Albugo laibachii Nc14]